MAVATGTALALGATAAASAYSANQQRKAASAAGGVTNNTDTFTRYGSSTLKVPTANGQYYVRQTIDPRIRTLREQSLARLPGYRSSLTDAYSQLTPGLQEARTGFQNNYQSLMSNENPFIQARVNPLLQRAAAQRGDLQRSMVNRGLGGSSFYSQSLGNFERELAGAEGDQRALATQEAIVARRQALSDMVGIDSQIYNSALSSIQALQGLDTTEREIAAANLAQELSALGLSQSDASAILGAAGLQMQGAQLRNETIGRGLDVAGRLIGSYGSSNAGSGTFFP